MENVVEEFDCEKFMKDLFPNLHHLPVLSIDGVNRKDADTNKGDKLILLCISK